MTKVSQTVRCGSCEAVLDEPPGQSEQERQPCPKCGSKSVGALSCDPDDLKSVIQRKGRVVAKSDKRLLDQLSESAEVVRKYGKAAIVVQAGRRLGPGDAKRILRKERRISDRLFELIMQAERDALKRRFL